MHFDFGNEDIFCYKCNVSFSSQMQHVSMQMFLKHVTQMFYEHTMGRKIRLLDFGEYHFLVDLNEKLKLSDKIEERL